MKFIRLVDNKPAYTKGKVYSTVEDGCEYLCDELTGVVIENDMNSKCYYSLISRYSIQEFNRLWKEVK